MIEKIKKEKIRTGFTKVNERGDWKLENGVLSWRDSLETSINVDELPKITPMDVIQLCPTNRKRRKQIIADIKNNSSFSKKDRFTQMKWSVVMEKDLFFNVAEVLLPSSKWNDDEKLFFLWGRLISLSGFEDGEKVHKLLSKIKWKNNSFVKRMNDFYSSAREYSLNGSDSIWQTTYDEKMIKSFSDEVILYRGFNVPPSASIREKDIDKWLKQNSGKSVYYSIDEKVARRFACIQKYQFVKLSHKSGICSPDMRELIEGKITIARYRVSIDDIILFDDVLGCDEGECICLPENVDLLDYQFIGFNDFIDILKSPRPRKKPTPF